MDGAGQVTDARHPAVGYSVLQAHSLDEAMHAVKDHPHFHAPDGAITVLEMLSMPGL